MTPKKQQPEMVTFNDNENDGSAGKCLEMHCYIAFDWRCPLWIAIIFSTVVLSKIRKVQPFKRAQCIYSEISIIPGDFKNELQLD